MGARDLLHDLADAGLSVAVAGDKLVVRPAMLLTDTMRAALREFKPELIVVPSGFDASGVDPLGRMMVSTEGYRKMTKLLLKAADDLCGGRLVMSHEGGYSPMYVPYCGLAVMEEMSGIFTGVADPWGTHMSSWGQQSLQPHQEQAIAAAAKLVVNIE